MSNVCCMAVDDGWCYSDVIGFILVWRLQIHYITSVFQTKDEDNEGTFDRCFFPLNFNLL